MDKTKIIDIGPECFVDGDLEVISYKGENYYRACNEIVINGGSLSPTSYCIKRVHHPGFLHEDYDGLVKDARF